MVASSEWCVRRAVHSASSTVATSWSASQRRMSVASAAFQHGSSAVPVVRDAIWSRVRPALSAYVVMWTPHALPPVGRSWPRSTCSAGAARSG